MSEVTGLSREGTAARQDKIAAVLDSRNLDAALISAQEDIYYFTGLLPVAARRMPAALLLMRDGSSILATLEEDGKPYVGDRVSYGRSRCSPVDPDPLSRLCTVLEQRLGGLRLSAVGMQSEDLTTALAASVAAATKCSTWVPIDEDLAQIQRSKHADEIALIRRSIDCTLAGYTAASARILPGAREIEVFTAGQCAANVCAGEPVAYGGEFQSASKGGPARDRRIKQGELYIVDSWAVFRGYWSDLSRTYAVGAPTRLQVEVFDHLRSILSELPRRLGPDLSGSDLWTWADREIRRHPHLSKIGLPHHIGHGIGVRPHEYPTLSRSSDDRLQPGDVVCCEPGSYSLELNVGVRVENTFLITETGCELLSDYPVALAPGTSSADR